MSSYTISIPDSPPKTKKHFYGLLKKPSSIIRRGLFLFSSVFAFYAGLSCAAFEMNPREFVTGAVFTSLLTTTLFLVRKTKKKTKPTA